MAMKKIKPQYGKVVAPAVSLQQRDGVLQEEVLDDATTTILEAEASEATTQPEPEETSEELKKEKKARVETKKNDSGPTSDPNPFLQTKEVFGKARLTKIGYRMRTDYVEILDIIKKMKKNGYTLEAVLDDALTYYFEQSEDGKEAIRKAQIFYS